MGIEDFKKKFAHIWICSLNNFADKRELKRQERPGVLSSIISWAGQKRKDTTTNHFDSGFILPWSALRASLWTSLDDQSLVFNQTRCGSCNMCTIHSLLDRFFACQNLTDAVSDWDCIVPAAPPLPCARVMNLTCFTETERRRRRRRKYISWEERMAREMLQVADNY